MQLIYIAPKKVEDLIWKNRFNLNVMEFDATNLQSSEKGGIS